MASASGDRLSSTEFRRRKEIDDARKAGTLPPEQDDEGNLINPHNPEYISKRPWYLGDSGPSLKHQTIQNKDHLLSIHEADELYVRGRKISSETTSYKRKFQKGACKNCGATTHKTNECVERPRKVGAWKTGKNIQNDEVLIDVRSQAYGKLSFDAKRDQWLGYDPKEHNKTIEKYKKIEDARAKARMAEVDKDLNKSSLENQENTSKSKRKNEKVSNTTHSDSDSDYESDISSQEGEYRDNDNGQMFTERVARQGGVGGAQMKTTVRNLRIREDTAKYLRNLNPNSAYYDPKTRAMRQNPNPDINPEDSTYAGDNFARYTGDAKKLAQSQLFAWEAYEKGTDIHPLANPSQAEFLKRSYEEKKEKLKKERQQKILETYGTGNAKEMKQEDKELLILGTSEAYVEYSREGKVVKGRERKKVQSKYIEDQLENNHTAIWGSYFNRQERAWGYKCCHSTVRRSYCTGEAGKLATQAATIDRMKSIEASMHKKEEKDSLNSIKSVLGKRSEMYGENLAPSLDPKKLKKAVEKAKREEKKEKPKKSSKYNSGTDAMGEVSAEDMEAYKLMKNQQEDPMAKYLNTDTLLEE